MRILCLQTKKRLEFWLGTCSSCKYLEDFIMMVSVLLCVLLCSYMLYSFVDTKRSTFFWGMCAYFFMLMGRSEHERKKRLSQEVSMKNRRCAPSIVWSFTVDQQKPLNDSRTWTYKRGWALRWFLAWTKINKQALAQRYCTESRQSERKIMNLEVESGARQVV